jgi:hypothetical protein
VRVISHHADDDDRRQALYVANSYSDWCRKADEKNAERTGDDLFKGITDLAAVRVKRDDALRKLFDRVLNHADAEKDTILRSLSQADTADILWACQGITPISVTSAVPSKP